MKIIVDTNVIISALVKNGFSRDFIINKNFSFELITPAYIFSEINKYKNYICLKANINEEQFYFLLATIFKYIHVINPIYYSSYLDESGNIIGHIHKTDVPFIATALAFNCPIWSDDKHFKKQNKVKILTTKDILKHI